MYYIIILQVAGIFLGTVSPEFVSEWLILDMGKVFQGQIWRLFTFIITSYSFQVTGGNIMNLLIIAIELYLYYFISRSLESVWGAFRFNLYYLSGLVLNIIVAIVLYFVYREFGVIYQVTAFGLTYINQSLFFAFAAIYPNLELLYMFFLPLKVKYLGYLYGAYVLYDVIMNFVSGRYAVGISIIIALLNFVVFFFSSRKAKRVSPKQVKRRVQYQKEVHSNDGMPRHRCAVCGRTELDDENLEFRYCSKCDGNYEYCMEHLFTHEHVRRH